jgi:hypothetical protein
VLDIVLVVVFWAFAPGVTTVVDGDVAVVTDALGRVTGAVGSFLVWVVASVVFVVVGTLKSMLNDAWVVWEAVSSVLGAAWVLVLLQVAISVCT